MPYIKLYLQLKVMANFIISFFTSLLPSSKPSPTPQPNRLISDTHAVGDFTTRTETSVFDTTAAAAGTSNEGSSYSSPGTIPPQSIVNHQQVRDQRAQFLDKLSKGPARGKWRRGNKASHGRPNMQAPPSSS